MQPAASSHVQGLQAELTFQRSCSPGQAPLLEGAGCGLSRPQACIPGWTVTADPEISLVCGSARMMLVGPVWGSWRGSLPIWTEQSPGDALHAQGPLIGGPEHTLSISSLAWVRRVCANQTSPGLDGPVLGRGASGGCADLSVGPLLRSGVQAGPPGSSGWLWEGGRLWRRLAKLAEVLPPPRVSCPCAKAGIYYFQQRKRQRHGKAVSFKNAFH